MCVIASITTKPSADISPRAAVLSTAFCLFGSNMQSSRRRTVMGVTSRPAGQRMRFYVVMVPAELQIRSRMHPFRSHLVFHETGCTYL
jgi:hypothetical protein